MLQVNQPAALNAPTVTELQVGGIGALDSTAGANTWDTPITLAGNTAIGTELGDSLIIDQTIGQSAASTLTKVGGGTTLLSGTGSNTYGGLTTVAGGVLELGKSSGVAVPADLTVGNGVSPPGSEIAQLEGNAQLLSTAVLTVLSDGIFDLNGNLQTIGALNMTGGTVELTGSSSILTLGGNVTAQADAAGNPATINSAGLLELNGVDRTFTVNGPAFASPAVADMVIGTAIDGTVGFTKAGPGTLQLTDSNPTLDATITGGALLADAPIGNTLDAVTLDTLNAKVPALLGGVGTVGAVTPASSTVGGIVQPGDGANLTGTLSSIPDSGTDTWNSATDLSLVLNDAQPGDFSQLAVTGDIDLGGVGSATPSPTGGGEASLSGFIGTAGTGVNIGDTYTILTTTGTVTGRFAEPYGEVTPGGLGIAFIGGQKFTVDYSNPQQVVLTAVMQDATVALSSSVANTATAPVYGQNVAFTATVTPEPGAGVIPNGDTVTFTLDEGTANAVSENLILSNGIATFDPSTFTGIPLSVGPHTINATFNGDNNFNVETAPTLTETVKKANSSISVSALPVNPVPGEGVVVTATITPVSPGGGVPSGTATFIVDNVALASGPVTLTPGGQAIVTLTFPQASAHTVKVTYSGDGNFLGTQTAKATTINVIKGNPTVQVAATPLTSSYGQSVLFQVTVTGPITPSGTVTFYNGAATQVNSLGTITLDANGQGSVSTAGLSAGQHTINAVYGGSTSFNAATGTLLNFQVNQASTQTTLSVTPTTAAYAQPITLSATVAVTGNGAGTPSGKVTFFDGSTALNAGALVNLSGKATFVTSSPLAIGVHQLTAQFDGSSNFASSPPSNTVDVTIQVGTSVTVTSSSNPSVYGQLVNLTATVKPLSSANIAEASGETLAFFDGPAATGILLGTANLNASGVAVLAGSSFGPFSVDVGNVPHSINVVYLGDSLFLGSTGTLNQVVNRSSTSTKLTASANPSPFGSPITFTASVAAAGNGVGIPTGTVNFYDGTAIAAHLLGSNTLDNTGTTTFTTTTNLTIGLHVITAVYADDANFATSQTTLSETIKAAATTTTLAVSDPDPVYSEPLTLTATVASAGGNPTGTVTFYDGAILLADKIGTGTLSTTLGVTTATFTTTTLTVATHNLNASYGGSSNFASSPTTAATTVIVQQDTITPTITSSLNPSAQNTPVTFSVTVSADSPGTATPTGTVTFYDDTNAASPGTGILLSPTAATLKATNVAGLAVATFATSSLNFGADTIDAFYSGSAGFAGSGTTNFAEMTQTVLFADTVTLSAIAVVHRLWQHRELHGDDHAHPVGRRLSDRDGDLLRRSGGQRQRHWARPDGEHEPWRDHGDLQHQRPECGHAPHFRGLQRRSQLRAQQLARTGDAGDCGPVHDQDHHLPAVEQHAGVRHDGHDLGRGHRGIRVRHTDRLGDLLRRRQGPVARRDAGQHRDRHARDQHAQRRHHAQHHRQVHGRSQLPGQCAERHRSRHTHQGDQQHRADLLGGYQPGGRQFGLQSAGDLHGGSQQWVGPRRRQRPERQGDLPAGRHHGPQRCRGDAQCLGHGHGHDQQPVGGHAGPALPHHHRQLCGRYQLHHRGDWVGGRRPDHRQPGHDQCHGQCPDLGIRRPERNPVRHRDGDRSRESGTPTVGELVTFYDGTTKIGTGTLNAKGVATLVTSSLSLGLHNINISYAGDNNYFASQNSVPASITISGQTVNSFSGAATKAVNPLSAFSFVVTALDANGNQVMSDNSPVTISLVSSSTGGTLSGTLSGTFSHGVFTFNNLKVSKAGTYKIKITSNGVSSTVTLTTGNGRFT